MGFGLILLGRASEACKLQIAPPTSDGVLPLGYRAEKLAGWAVERGNVAIEIDTVRIVRAVAYYQGGAVLGRGW